MHAPDLRARLLRRRGYGDDLDRDWRPHRILELGPGPFQHHRPLAARGDDGRRDGHRAVRAADVKQPLSAEGVDIGQHAQRLAVDAEHLGPDFPAGAGSARGALAGALPAGSCAAAGAATSDRATALVSKRVLPDICGKVDETERPPCVDPLRLAFLTARLYGTRPFATSPHRGSP